MPTVGVGVQGFAPALPLLNASLIDTVSGKLEKKIRRYEFLHGVEFRPIEPVSHYRAGFVESVEAFGKNPHVFIAFVFYG